MVNALLFKYKFILLVYFLINFMGTLFGAEKKPKEFTIYPSSNSDLCANLDEHIPFLMSKIDAEKTNGGLGIFDCQAVKNIFEEFGKNKSCEQDYKNYRDIYNRLVARKSLVEEVKKNKEILKSKSESEYKRQAIARLDYLHQSFGNFLNNVQTFDQNELVKSIKEKVNCNSSEYNCDQLFSDDFFNKLSAVLKIGYECEKNKSSCQQSSNKELMDLDQQVIAILQNVYTSSNKINFTSSSPWLASNFNIDESKGKKLDLEISNYNLCNEMNRRIIFDHSGKKVSDFKDNLFNPEKKTNALKKDFEEMFGCQFSPNDNCSKFLIPDLLDQKISSYEKKLKQIKPILEKPNGQIVEMRNFLKTSLRTFNSICQKDALENGSGIIKSCSMDDGTKLQIFASAKNQGITLLDSFSDVKLEKLNENVAFQELLSDCEKKEIKTSFSTFCQNISTNKKQVSLIPTNRSEYIKQQKIYEEGCRNQVNCKIVRDWNEETDRYDYTVKVGVGQKSAGTWGEIGKGFTYGLFGVGYNGYFGYEGPFAGALKQWSFGQTFPAFYQNYQTVMMPYWEQQHYYNNFYSQYQEALYLQSIGIPQQLNPEYFGTSTFTGSNTFYGF